MNKKRKHEGHRERKTRQFKALRKKKKHGEFLKEMLIWRNSIQPQCSSSFLNVK